MENKIFSSKTIIPLPLASPSSGMDSSDAPAQTDASDGLCTAPRASSRAIFHCSLDRGGNQSHWDASVCILFCSPRMCEAVAEGRSTTFHFIVGHHRDGRFLCVPSHGFGCELSRLSDTFWNSERIREHLCPVDSATLVAAVACLDTLWPYAHLQERRHYV